MAVADDISNGTFISPLVFIKDCIHTGASTATFKWIWKRLPLQT